MDGREQSELGVFIPQVPIPSDHGVAVAMSLPKPWLLSYDPLLESQVSLGSGNQPIPAPLHLGVVTAPGPQAITRSKVLRCLLLVFLNTVQIL